MLSLLSWNLSHPAWCQQGTESQKHFPSRGAPLAPHLSLRDEASGPMPLPCTNQLEPPSGASYSSVFQNPGENVGGQDCEGNSPSLKNESLEPWVFPIDVTVIILNVTLLRCSILR